MKAGLQSLLLWEKRRQEKEKRFSISSPNQKETLAEIAETHANSGLSQSEINEQLTIACKLMGWS